MNIKGQYSRQEADIISFMRVNYIKKILFISHRSKLVFRINYFDFSGFHLNEKLKLNKLLSSSGRFIRIEMC